MQANLYANFRLLAGEKTILLDPEPHWTVRDAAEAIVTRCPDLRRHWLKDNGDLNSHVHIFLNGQNVNGLPEKLQSSVCDGDTLDFFPPTAGG